MGSGGGIAIEFVADEAAEKIILADLALIAPGVPVVAEEAVAAGLPDHAHRDALGLERLMGRERLVERDPGGEHGRGVARRLAQHLAAPDGEPLLAPVEDRRLLAGRAQVRDPLTARHLPRQLGAVLHGALDVG